MEKLHAEQILHNGLSPGSILLGRTFHNPKLFLVDFKHSLKLLDGKHIEIAMDKGVEAESHPNIDEFSSVNKTLKIPQSKKDELESLLYILLYLYRGGTVTSKAYEKTYSRKSLFDISKWKASASPETICEGLPDSFALYLTYLRSLIGQERPNYKFLRSLFLKCITGNKFTKSLSEILAFDIIKVVAEHKSRNEFTTISVNKATVPSEKVIQLADDCIGSDDETHPVPPLNQSTKSIGDIFWTKTSIDSKFHDAGEMVARPSILKAGSLRHLTSPR